MSRTAGTASPASSSAQNRPMRRSCDSLQANGRTIVIKDIPDNSTVVNNPAYIVKKSADKGKNFCAYGIENDDISIKPAEKKNKKAK